MSANVYSGITVDPMKAAKIIGTCIKAGTTAMMWGKWGVGKTSIAYQVVEKMNPYFDSCIVINPSQDDVIDFKLPYVDEITVDEKKYTASKFAVSERLPRKGRHLIFVDEINTATPAMQATLYSLILEGRIGSYKLPDGCIRIAAGNREEDGCAALPMSNALKDRLGVHMNIVPSEASWIKWATTRGNIVPEVVAFVRNMPTVLEGHCSNESGDPTGGCTPRSLEALSKMIGAGTDEDILHNVANGIIGQGAGAEFVGFLDIYKNNVDIDEIIKKPEKAPVPKKMDVLYAITSALGAKMNKDNIENIVVYLKRMDRRYMLMAMNDAHNRDESIRTHPAMAAFIRENFKYFI